MKKSVCIIMLILAGFLSPEFVKCIQNTGKPVPNEEVPVDEDSVKALFCRNPSVNNYDLLWEPLVYQCNIIRQYDLFIYLWYTGYNDSINSARYTLHRMLTDTIFDKSHYIPNSIMLEFTNKLKPLSSKKIKDENKVD